MRTDQEAGPVHFSPTDTRRDFTLALTQMRNQLYRLALTLAREPSSADDLVQATLERALLSWEQFRSGSDLKAWTKSILRNCFIDDYRRSRMAAQPLTLPVATVPDPEIGPADVFSIDDVKRIAQTLEDDVSRTLFDMAYFQRRPHREIARKTGISVGTVATRLLRVRREMRRRMLADYAGHFQPEALLS